MLTFLPVYANLPLCVDKHSSVIHVNIRLPAFNSAISALFSLFSCVLRDIAEAARLVGGRTGLSVSGFEGRLKKKIRVL